MRGVILLHDNTQPQVTVETVDSLGLEVLPLTVVHTAQILHTNIGRCGIMLL